mmetsp:Transcript_33484/g.70176  ORF Transcript_33484/g.70176 Transcript_33484/m.70176 type:complete len:100 (-) Transcript_33484:45-344(-)
MSTRRKTVVWKSTIKKPTVIAPKFALRHDIPVYSIDNSKSGAIYPKARKKPIARKQINSVPQTACPQLCQVLAGNKKDAEWRELCCRQHVKVQQRCVLD